MFVRMRRVTRSMNNTPAASIPITTPQSTQPTIIQLEDDVPTLVPKTTCMDEPTLKKDNSTKSIKNIIESGKAKVAPSCMDAHSSDPEPSFISLQSSGQNVDNPNPP